MIHASGVPIVCCGENMTELVANTTEASTEKHLPEVKIEGSKVTAVVGSVEHPMEEKHWIQWIYLATNKAGHRYCLNPGISQKLFFISQKVKHLLLSMNTAIFTVYGLQSSK